MFACRFSVSYNNQASTVNVFPPPKLFTSSNGRQENLLFCFAEVLFIQVSANPEAPVSELEVQKTAKRYSDKG